MLAFRHALIQEICEFSPHVIGGHFALYTWPALGRMKNLPLVQHFHGPWYSESKIQGCSRLNCWARYKLERSVYNRADALITLSEVFKNVLLTDFKIHESRVKVIPGGVDCGRFDIPQSKVAARHLLDWPQDRPIVFSVRRLTPRMGLENLLLAINAVKTDQPDALFLIAGTGPLRATLEQQINNLHLQDHVRLLGYLPDDKLPLAYRAADFSVVPSTALEGFGLVAVESLAAGTPALVSPVGGLREVIQPFSDALLLRSSSVGDITQGLIRCLTNLSKVTEI